MRFCSLDYDTCLFLLYFYHTIKYINTISSIAISFILYNTIYVMCHCSHNIKTTPRLLFLSICIQSTTRIYIHTHETCLRNLLVILKCSLPNRMRVSWTCVMGSVIICIHILMIYTILFINVLRQLRSCLVDEDSSRNILYYSQIKLANIITIHYLFILCNAIQTIEYIASCHYEHFATITTISNIVKIVDSISSNSIAIIINLYFILYTRTQCIIPCHSKGFSFISKILFNLPHVIYSSSYTCILTYNISQCEDLYGAIYFTGLEHRATFFISLLFFIIIKYE